MTVCCACVCVYSRFAGSLIVSAVVRGCSLRALGGVAGRLLSGGLFSAYGFVGLLRFMTDPPRIHASYRPQGLWLKRTGRLQTEMEARLYASPGWRSLE